MTAACTDPVDVCCPDVDIAFDDSCGGLDRRYIIAATLAKVTAAILECACQPIDFVHVDWGDNPATPPLKDAIVVGIASVAADRRETAEKGCFTSHTERYVIKIARCRAKLDENGAWPVGSLAANAPGTATSCARMMARDEAAMFDGLNAAWCKTVAECLDEGCCPKGQMYVANVTNDIRQTHNHLTLTVEVR